MFALISRSPRALWVLLLATFVSSCRENLTDPPAQAASALPPQGGPFHPSSSLVLPKGSYAWSDVVIPAGVTITASGDVNIQTTGDFNLTGTLTGNCVAVSIVAAGRLTLGGTIANSCSTLPDAAPPAMRLVGLGGYTVDHGNVTTSGDFNITNDTTITDSSFAAVSQSLAAHAPSMSRLPATHVRSANTVDTGVPCDMVAGVFLAKPQHNSDGKDGKHGTRGLNGTRWIAACNGDMEVVDDFSVTGQSGGHGGYGDDESPNADAAGGDGGTGGLLSLLVHGDLEFDVGSNTTLTSGDGGHGFPATATASQPGGSAKAVGGAGGAPGLVEVLASGTISVDGILNIVVGQAGAGGNAGAMAADGAAPCPVEPGGNATAKGGVGGSTPDKMLKAVNVHISGNVHVSGGAAGKGGDALTVAGNGSNGAQGCISGAAGGSQTTNGGYGGDALLKNLSGAYIDDGGDGGNAEFNVGNGGTGANGCPNNPGGAGGVGGDASGDAGLGGIGLSNGVDGKVTIINVGNGGDGGPGKGPGLGGNPGVNDIGPFDPKPSITPPIFTRGKDGAACPTPPPPPPPAIMIEEAPSSVSAVAGISSTAHIVITIARANFDGPVYVSFGTLPTGVSVNPTTLTIPAGQTQAAVDLTIQEEQAEDVAVVFTAMAAANGATFMSTSTLPIHVAAATQEPMFNVSIVKAATTNSDPSGVDPLLGVTSNHVLGVQSSTVNNLPTLTVDHLVVGTVSMVLTNSGATVSPSTGDFTVTGKATIQMATYGAQPVQVMMQGHLGTSSSGTTLTFTLTVFAQSTATFQFLPVTYTGSGTPQ